MKAKWEKQRKGLKMKTLKQTNATTHTYAYLFHECGLLCSRVCVSICKVSLPKRKHLLVSLLFIPYFDLAKLQEVLYSYSYKAKLLIFCNKAMD